MTTDCWPPSPHNSDSQTFIGSNVYSAYLLLRAAMNCQANVAIGRLPLRVVQWHQHHLEEMSSPWSIFIAWCWNISPNLFTLCRKCLQGWNADLLTRRNWQNEVVSHVNFSNFFWHIPTISPMNLFCPRSPCRCLPLCSPRKTSLNFRRGLLNSPPPVVVDILSCE